MSSYNETLKAFGMGPEERELVLDVIDEASALEEGVLDDIIATSDFLVGSEAVASAAVQALTDSGAVNVTALLTTLAVTGTDAYTLADGTFAGQMKYIRCISAGSTPSGVLTPTNLAGADSTITFDAAGEQVTLLWDGTNWQIAALTGATVA